MTDRELLEYAAKAAGYLPRGIFGKGLLVVVGVGTVKQNAFPFDPFNDDGDALRLAVKLGLAIIQHSKLKDGRLEVAVFVDGNLELEPYSSDPYAATRRAIVRAAAEIGKAMT